MNILRRISAGYAALIAVTVAIAAICLLSLVYVSDTLDSQRAKQVQLTTLTESVKGGFYAEIDSARQILLERAFNSPTHTDAAAISQSRRARRGGPEEASCPTPRARPFQRLRRRLRAVRPGPRAGRHTGRARDGSGRPPQSRPTS